jgi:hypothetical protein
VYSAAAARDKTWAQRLRLSCKAGDFQRGVLPGSAILLNGVVETANQEIGDPGFQHFRVAPSFKT